MQNVAVMEPMMPESGRRKLEDLATELVGKANALAGRVHPVVRQSVGDLVRSMNCYYSNLIEGHDTHPRDIDRALVEDYSTEPKKRALQLEARAHIEVQRMIDWGEVDLPLISADFVLWVHQEFGKRLPDELLWVENPDTKEKVRNEPGELRRSGVQVGYHVPPGANELPAFMARFEEAYRLDRLSKLQQVIAVAASHHRLLWIHPFYDGNGRVARLFSHRFLKEIGLGNSLWSASRGLARRNADYKARLMGADQDRWNDLDGRGTLSAGGLEAFCSFFLEVCIDQVSFMESLLEPAELRRRMSFWAEDETRAGRLPKGAWPLLREVLNEGEVERGLAPEITGYKERQARTVLTDLMKRGLLVSDTQRGPVRLGFPIDVVERWFPQLYPGLG